jgi:hypothetical protein
MTVQERYQFDETGVGCANHGLPSCLCDVTLDTVRPILYATDEVRFGSFACERSDTFHEWAELLLGCAAAAEERPDLFDALEILRESKTHPRPTSSERMATERRIALALLRGGCDLEGASSVMATTIQRLVRILTTGAGRLCGWPEERILQLERRVLGGPEQGTTYVELAQEFDMPRTAVKRFADWYGIELAISTTPYDARSFALTLPQSVPAAEVADQIRERFGVEVKLATIWKWRSRARA